MQVQVITAGVLVVTVSVLVTVLALLYTMPKPMLQHTCDTLCLPSIPFSHGSDLQCGCSSDRLQEYLDEAIIQKVKRLEQDDKDKKNPTPGPSPQLMGMLKSLRWNIKPSARVTGKKQPPPLQAEQMPSNKGGEYEEKANKDEKQEFLNDGNVGRSSDKRWKIAAVVMVVVNIILLASILAVTITWRNERAGEALNMKQESIMCLPCENVYHHPDDVTQNPQGFDKRTEGDRYMCCGHASKHLDQLVSLYTEKAHQKEKNLKLLTSNPYNCKEGSQVVKPSAHLVGITKSIQDMHDHHMLKWNQTGKLSKLNEVVYEDGKIRVKSSGYYYIYSQITYQDGRDSSPYNDNAIVLHHSIHKEYNGGGDTTREKLLESSQSRCQIIGEKSNKTSYIGAVFYLKENDLIQVRVSHPPKLLPSEHSNYFGMYLT